ncbi:MAG: hypothetical protein EBT86_00015 [Actinobacteria bacterium]|nr:hypothetical protein [Actinomycetota bacterium]
MIPKIAFTYWEGDEFSFLNELTVHTFIYFNPDFKVIIYIPEKKSSNHKCWDTNEQKLQIPKTGSLENLKKYSNVEFVEINIEKIVGINYDLTSVHRSDYLRLLKLYEHGGFWFDFDILFIKNIPNNYLMSDKLNVIKYNHYDIIPIGFVWCNKNNSLIKKILMDAEQILYEKVPVDYQILGAPLWRKILNLSNDYEIHKQQVIYPFLWHEPEKIFFENYIDISELCIGIHWFNGNNITRQYLRDIKNIRLEKNNFINSYIKKLPIIDNIHICNI